jgi:hypothetical protein
MNSSGSITDALIGPFRVPEGQKLSSATYCPYLKKSLESRLDKLPLATLKKITLTHVICSKGNNGIPSVVWFCEQNRNGLATKLAKFEPN